jgi:hypothetical protein
MLVNPLLTGKKVDVAGQKIDNFLDELKRRIVYAHCQSERNQNEDK